MKPSLAVRKSKYALPAFLILLSSILFIVWIQGQSSALGTDQGNGLYPEIEVLQEKQLNSFTDLSNYFGDLANEKGAEYAYEVLKIAPTPPNIDMHLLGHVVGDINYEQQELEGIKICTHDFRNACSHAIVIGLFLERGEAALPEIAEACYAAPGGSGAYTMCFHGLGHGVLAYTGYELEKAVELCKKVGTPEYQNEEYAQCASGAIMEIVNGVHDRNLWAEQRVKYFKEADPLYPCSSDFIDDTTSQLCYTYLTPHLWEAASGNLSGPTPLISEKAFQFCNVLPANDFRNRDACYGGFGKEFVGLVQGRDIRLGSLEAITEQQLTQVYEWCLLAHSQDGSEACMAHAMHSLYWGGENDQSIAIRFCSNIPDAYYANSCFMNLIGAVSYYIQDQNYKTSFCTELPDSYRKNCRTRLSAN